MFPNEWKREASSSDYFFRPFEPLDESAINNSLPPEKPYWKDFVHIPYEPETVDKTPCVLLLPVDPFRIWAGHQRPTAHTESRHHLILRVMDVTTARSRGDRSSDPRADYSFELDPGESQSWFIPLWSTGRSLYALMGFVEEGQFVTIARSNEVRTPMGRVRGTRGRFLQVAGSGGGSRKSVSFPGRPGNSTDRPFGSFPSISSPFYGGSSSPGPRSS